MVLSAYWKKTRGIGYACDVDNSAVGNTGPANIAQTNKLLLNNDQPNLTTFETNPVQANPAQATPVEITPIDLNPVQLPTYLGKFH